MVLIVIILENGTGNLIIKATELKLKSSSGEDFINCTADGSVELQHNDAKVFETTATGVAVTGTILATTDTDTSNTGNVTLDFAANQNFVLTLTGNTTLVNPTT